MSYVEDYELPIRLPNGQMARNTLPLIEQYGVSPTQGRTPTGQLMSFADTQRSLYNPQPVNVRPGWGATYTPLSPISPMYGPANMEFGPERASPSSMLGQLAFDFGGDAAVGRAMGGSRPAAAAAAETVRQIPGQQMFDFAAAAPQQGWRGRVGSALGGVGRSMAGSGGAPRGLWGGVGWNNMKAPLTTPLLGRVFPSLASTGGLGAGLLRGGAYGVAGHLGGGLAEQLLDDQGWGLAGDVLGSAARFAPLGAFGGPIGIGIAAGAGGLWGLATGDRGGEDEAPTAGIKEALAPYVEPGEFARADALVETYKEMGSTEEEALQQAYAPLIAQVEQSTTREAEAENILALQMASQSAMAPIIAQSNQRLRQFENHMNSLIPTLPENYQNVFRASVPEVAMWQGMMNDANSAAALTAPLANYIRNAQFESEAGGDSYEDLMAELGG